MHAFNKSASALAAVFRHLWVIPDPHSAIFLDCEAGGEIGQYLGSRGHLAGLRLSSFRGRKNA